MDESNKIITITNNFRETPNNTVKTIYVEATDLDALNEDSPEYIDFAALSNRGIDIYLPQETAVDDKEIPNKQTHDVKTTSQNVRRKSNRIGNIPGRTILNKRTTRKNGAIKGICIKKIVNTKIVNTKILERVTINNQILDQETINNKILHQEILDKKVIIQEMLDKRNAGKQILGSLDNELFEEEVIDDDIIELKPHISLVELSDSEDDERLDKEMPIPKFKTIVGHKDYKKVKERCNCVNCSKGIKPKRQLGHLCGICNKVYKKTSHYRYHQMLHSNQRISCSYCGKLFHRPDMFKRHLRIHLGERNFECDICNKKFFRSDHLKKHQKTHEKQIERHGRYKMGSVALVTSENDRSLLKELLNESWRDMLDKAVALVDTKEPEVDTT